MHKARAVTAEGHPDFSEKPDAGHEWDRGSSWQGHLDDERGIALSNAREKGLSGEGVTICVVGRSFDPTHPNLEHTEINVIYPLDSRLVTGGGTHDTKVLGVLAARKSKSHALVTGICPDADFLFAGEGGSPEAPVKAAVDRLDAGDILVLQMQAGGPPRPIESDPGVFHLIRAAAEKGVIVIEAAGTSRPSRARDLKGFKAKDGQARWDPHGRDGREWDGSSFYGDHDSGAIIVGGGNSGFSATPHARHPESNYGTRVDCQGWGENVFTTGKGPRSLHLRRDEHAQADYTPTFDGTSAATAMVAGVVALCVEHLKEEAKRQEERTGKKVKIEFKQIRRLLRECGIKQADPGKGRIGPLPQFNEKLFLGLGELVAKVEEAG